MVVQLRKRPAVLSTLQLIHIMLELILYPPPRVLPPPRAGLTQCMPYNVVHGNIVLRPSRSIEENSMFNF